MLQLFYVIAVSGNAYGAVPLKASAGHVTVARSDGNPFSHAVLDLVKYYGEPVQKEHAPTGPDECLTGGDGLPAVLVPTVLEFSFDEGRSAHDSLGRGLDALLVAWKAAGHPAAWLREDLGPGAGFRLIQTEQVTEAGVAVPWVSPLGTRITLEASFDSVDAQVERILGAIPGETIELGDSRTLHWDLKGGDPGAIEAKDEPARDVMLRALAKAGAGNAYTYLTHCFMGTPLVTLRGAGGYGRWILGPDGEMKPPPVEPRVEPAP